MVGKDFKVGDLVWAKMKGFPYWPSRVERPSMEIKRPKSKQCHYIYFFGTKDFGWIAKDSILPHSEDRILCCSKKKQSKTFKNAINEIIKLNKRKRKSPAVIKVKIEDSPPNPSPVISSENMVKQEENTQVGSPKGNLAVSKRKRPILSSPAISSENIVKQEENAAQVVSPKENLNVLHRKCSILSSPAISSDKKIKQEIKALKVVSPKKNVRVSRKKLPILTSPAISSENTVKLEEKALKVVSPKENGRVPKRKLSIHQQSPPSKFVKMDEHCSASSSVPSNVGIAPVAVSRPHEEEHFCHKCSGILPSGEYIVRPRTPTLDVHKVSHSFEEKKIRATRKKLGFLGLGMIGRGIVKNLINSGHNVTIWNRSPDKYHPFLNTDAVIGRTPADVVRSCDITFCCVSDPDAVKLLVFGNCGILKGLMGCGLNTKGYVEMTSIDPTTSIEIAEAITLAGGRYLEAPVNGSRQLSEEGSLVVLCAGDRELLKQCRTSFCAISRSTHYLGCDVGNASKMNLILSMFIGSTYAALAEAMALLECCKLSRRNFLAMLDLGPLDSPALVAKGRAMMDHNFEADVVLKHQQKNIILALSLGNSLQQSMLISAATNELYKRAKCLCYADHDVSALVCGAKY